MAPRGTRVRSCSSSAAQPLTGIPARSTDFFAARSLADGAGHQSFGGSALTLQSLSATHDLQDLVGDRRLPGLVVGQLQFLEQAVGVVGGLVHGRHAGAVLGGMAVQQGLVQLHLQALGDDLLHDGGAILPPVVLSPLRLQSWPKCFYLQVRENGLGSCASVCSERAASAAQGIARVANAGESGAALHSGD